MYMYQFSSCEFVVVVSILCVSKEQTTVDYNQNDFLYYDNYHYDYTYTYDDNYSYTHGDDYLFTYDDDSSNKYDNFYSYTYDNDVSKTYDFTNLSSADCVNQHSCKSMLFIKYCNCDVNCDVFKDCCHDAKVNNDYTTFSTKLREVSPFIRCDYIPEVYNRWFIFVVSSCPSDADDAIEYLCKNVDPSNIISRTPAVGNVTNLLYRNLYCAVCNREAYTLLYPHLTCSWETPYKGNYSTEDLVKMDECVVEYFANDVRSFDTKTLRFCYHTISECTNLSAIDSHKNECESGRNEYVFTTNNTYRNKGCYYCSDEVGGKASCDLYDVYNNTFAKNFRSVSKYSYRMLFDLENRRLKTEKRFGLLFGEHEEFLIGSDCSKNQMIDPFANICRDVFCSSGYYSSGFKCLAGNKSMFQNGYCTEIQFNEYEYHIINNTSIIVFASNKTYDDVNFVDGIAHVCIPVRILTPFLHRFDSIEGWLSFICGIVSVVCLLITSIVYMLPKLQNQPGRLLLSVSISLCLAQVLFLAAPRAEIDVVLCKTIGILDHFFFLASFMWMNVMSFDVFKTFSSSFNSVENNRKHFALYSLYSWGSSLCITLVSTLVDEITSWSYRPGYGVGACWITNNKGLLVFFVIPCALLIILNSIFFALSVRSICVTNRKSSKILRKASTCDLLISIKLSTVVGLTWLFGYVATWANNQLFWYLFIIFNGLQGLFIFLSFVLNKKVFKVVRQCFGFKIAETVQPMKSSSIPPTDSVTVL